MRAYVQPHGLDRAVAELAGRQHGVVAHRQLVRLGFGRGAIRVRLERGRLHQIHRGVYAVGHRHLSQRGRWMAAVLAAGTGAVLSHRSAAALWGLRPVWGGRIEVTVAGARRGRWGIAFHRNQLSADEVTAVDGIPVTTVPRTVFDLAAVAPPLQVERAMHEAEVRRLTDPLSLPDLLERYPRRRGSRVVKEILADLQLGYGITRSELEERFLAFLDELGMPRPELNVTILVGTRWIEVDCLWREERLTVELDGRAAHDTARAYERDRARDRALSAAGWKPLRVTWRALHRERETLAAELRLLFAPS